jgi:hypothetical protein
MLGKVSQVQLNKKGPPVGFEPTIERYLFLFGTTASYANQISPVLIPANRLHHSGQLRKVQFQEISIM